MREAVLGDSPPALGHGPQHAAMLQLLLFMLRSSPVAVDRGMQLGFFRTSEVKQPRGTPCAYTH